MSQEAKHTPTPWEAQDFCDGDDGFAIIGNNLGGLVAYASMSPLDFENQDTRQAEANAAFIVTAVNSYASSQAEIARLREALNSVISAIGDWSRPTGANGMVAASESHPLVAASREALAALSESK